MKVKLFTLVVLAVLGFALAVAAAPSGAHSNWLSLDGPDLVVTSATPTSFVIQNHSGVPTGHFSYRISSCATGCTFTYGKIAGLGAGQSVRADVASSTIEREVLLDMQDDVLESNEFNNVARIPAAPSRSVNFGAAGLQLTVPGPNLKITSVAPNGFVVMNVGTAPAGPFHVYVEEADTTDSCEGKPAQLYFVDGLPAGASGMVAEAKRTFYLFAAGVERTVTADIVNAVSESDEYDNINTLPATDC